MVFRKIIRIFVEIMDNAQIGHDRNLTIDKIGFAHSDKMMSRFRWSEGKLIPFAFDKECVRKFLDLQHLPFVFFFLSNIYSVGFLFCFATHTLDKCPDDQPRRINDSAVLCTQILTPNFQY